jgi:hypothetical protein
MANRPVYVCDHCLSLCPALYPVVFHLPHGGTCTYRWCSKCIDWTRELLEPNAKLASQRAEAIATTGDDLRTLPPAAVGRGPFSPGPVFVPKSECVCATDGIKNCMVHSEWLKNYTPGCCR